MGFGDARNVSVGEAKGTCQIEPKNIKIEQELTSQLQFLSMGLIPSTKSNTEFERLGAMFRKLRWSFLK